MYSLHNIIRVARIGTSSIELMTNRILHDQSWIIMSIIIIRTETHCQEIIDEF